MKVEKDRCKITGKEVYYTEEDAKEELHRIVERTYYKLTAKKPARYFLCNHCGQYHLTSKIKFN